MSRDARVDSTRDPAASTPSARRDSAPSTSTLAALADVSSRSASLAESARRDSAPSISPLAALASRAESARRDSAPSISPLAALASRAESARRDSAPSTSPLAASGAPLRDVSPAPAQLELTGTAATPATDGDLPRPKDDRVGRPIRAVWMLGDDDDRLLRRGTRDDLWSLQRSQQRPQAVI